jgi:predicted naringenin-chalcone synthase
MGMPSYILHIETGVPDFAYSQEFARERIKSWTESERDRRIIHHVYRQSGIGYRYSVCEDFANPDAAGLFPPDASGRIENPGTRARNDMFIRESRKLGVKVAGRALAACPEIRKDEITHVVTASCTGFGNPGLDYHLVTDLGLNPSVQRYHLGFMGCYAAFPALRMAQQFCEADPRALVLVLCLELCSLHLQINGGADSVLANALFADGAACAVVHARSDLADRSAYRLDRFASGLAVDGEKDMTWSIGDHGFNIVLSSYVPDLIEANIADLVAPVLADAGIERKDIAFWAVHPGGKAILDKVEKALGLAPDALAIPRTVLRQYGNMSSATILFVLKEFLREPSRPEKSPVCAMAFGPGLTIELGILHALPAMRAGQATKEEPACRPC